MIASLVGAFLVGCMDSGGAPNVTDIQAEAKKDVPAGTQTLNPDQINQDTMMMGAGKKGGAGGSAPAGGAIQPP